MYSQQFFVVENMQICLNDLNSFVLFQFNDDGEKLFRNRCAAGHRSLRSSRSVQGCHVSVSYDNALWGKRMVQGEDNRLCTCEEFGVSNQTAGRIITESSEKAILVTRYFCNLKVIEKSYELKVL